jgi:hypothetical protein
MCWTPPDPSPEFPAGEQLTPPCGNHGRLVVTTAGTRGQQAPRRASLHRFPAPGCPVPRITLRLTVATAVMSAAGSVVGLVATTAVYGAETTLLADEATAQDAVALVIVAPLLLFLTRAAARGSLAAWLCCLGALGFTVYNYAIYAFSIHFGPLFLVWVAVLGLSLFALITGLAALRPPAVRVRFAAAPRRLAGWFLVGMAVLFTLLWLSEIVPDLAAGRPSTSAADWDVPTNPVHVLDLAFFLPAVATTGLLLLRGHWLGYATTGTQLVFLELTCLPILVTPFVATARGHAPGWMVMAPIGVVAVATLVVLWQFLRPRSGRIPADGSTTT